MPRYKCKVDTVFTYEFEVNASSEDAAEVIASNTDVTELQEVEINTEVVSLEELPEIAALFTYPALPENASDRMKEAYKVMVEEIQLAAGQSIIDDSLNQEYSDDFTSLTGDFMNHESKEKVRKQSDTTKITQKQYDTICNQYLLYKNCLIPKVNSSQKFTEYLNNILGLNKSRSVYSKIWCGGVDRESLPKGA